MTTNNIEQRPIERIVNMAKPIGWGLVTLGGTYMLHDGVTRKDAQVKFQTSSAAPFTNLGHGLTPAEGEMVAGLGLAAFGTYKIVSRMLRETAQRMEGVTVLYRKEERDLDPPYLD